MRYFYSVLGRKEKEFGQGIRTSQKGNGLEMNGKIQDTGQGVMDCFLFDIG